MKLYVSFGPKHHHEIQGRTYNAHTVAAIECEDWLDGRMKAFAAFGPRFCTTYNEEALPNILRNCSGGVVPVPEDATQPPPDAEPQEDGAATEWNIDAVTNPMRAQAAAAALRRYCEFKNESTLYDDKRGVVGDLITDLLHCLFPDGDNDEDEEQLLDTALMNYRAEVQRGARY